MKYRIFTLLTAFGLLGSLAACGSTPSESEPTSTMTVATTTYPLYLLTCAVAEGVEDITIVPVVNQSMACLHDYTLTTADMKILEGADLVLLNGAELEDFLGSAVDGKPTVDCSVGMDLLTAEEDGEVETDPHIWLDPDRAAIMVENLAAGLAEADPEHAELYLSNAEDQSASLVALAEEARAELADLSCRELITFHEGFAYLADSMDLQILTAIEEEAGSEASAQEIREIVDLVNTHDLPAIFVEANGSDATALAIQRECDVAIFQLSMMMSGPEEYTEENNYETLFRANIAVLKEALS